MLSRPDTPGFLSPVCGSAFLAVRVDTAPPNHALLTEVLAAHVKFGRVDSIAHKNNPRLDPYPAEMAGVQSRPTGGGRGEAAILAASLSMTGLSLSLRRKGTALLRRGLRIAPQSVEATA